MLSFIVLGLVLSGALAAPVLRTPPAAPAAHQQVGAATEGCELMPQMRPEPWTRAYQAPAVDDAIATLVPQFKDRNLATLFANALPNALDSTVEHQSAADQNCNSPLGGPEECMPDSFIVTGDINAMWQRDSTNQAKPYLRYLAQQKGNDTTLTTFFRGLIARQTHNALLDPYANAFAHTSADPPGTAGDLSTKRSSSIGQPGAAGYLDAIKEGIPYGGEETDAYVGGIYERKYELDSIINPLDLAAKYFKASEGDRAPFGPKWFSAVDLMLRTMKDQQASTIEEQERPFGPAYNFKRAISTDGSITDTLWNGVGWPAARTGMVKSAFRPSDDACKFPFNVPGNAFAVAVLRDGLVPMLVQLGQSALATQATNLAKEIDEGIKKFGVVEHKGEQVYAYEVDGHGNYYIMDDANLPSLLAMPYYGYTNATDEIYLRTRKTILSDTNPWWSNGTAASGIGGPHVGLGHIWPMALTARGWTAVTDVEVLSMLETLVNSSACSGLIHESFSKDDFSDFTRPWFAWANSFFADFVLKVIDERPHLVLKPPNTE